MLFLDTTYASPKHIFPCQVSHPCFHTIILQALVLSDREMSLS
jgi:hypothetical protein